MSTFGSTYVSEDASFCLRLRSNDFLEFDLRQSDDDGAEPDEGADGRTFTLQMSLDGGAVTTKTATADGNVLRFGFAPGDLSVAGDYVGSVWDDAGQVMLPSTFAVPVFDVVGDVS